MSVPGTLEHSLCQLMWLTHFVVLHPGLVVFFCFVFKDPFHVHLNVLQNGVLSQELCELINT